MAENVISVLTYKSIQTMLELGGSQSWSLDPERARHCKFAVVCRNAKTRHPEGPEPHKSAFMVGKVSGVVPTTDNDGRWLIQFSDYALVNWPEEWSGRNPVAYWKTSDYEHDFGELVFEPMPRRHPSITQSGAGLTLKLDLPQNLEGHVNRRLDEGHFIDAGEYIRHLIRLDISSATSKAA